MGGLGVRVGCGEWGVGGGGCRARGSGCLGMGVGGCCAPVLGEWGSHISCTAWRISCRLLGGGLGHTPAGRGLRACYLLLDQVVLLMLLTCVLQDPGEEMLGLGITTC
jgi:hypothetical protein